MRNEGNVRDPGRKTIIDLRWRRFGRERRRESHIFPFFFSFFCPSPVFLFPRSRRLKEKLIARGIYGLRHKKKQNFMVENFRFAVFDTCNEQACFLFLFFIIHHISDFIEKSGKKWEIGRKKFNDRSRTMFCYHRRLRLHVYFTVSDDLRGRARSEDKHPYTQE